MEDFVKLFRVWHTASAACTRARRRRLGAFGATGLSGVRCPELKPTQSRIQDSQSLVEDRTSSHSHRATQRILSCRLPHCHPPLESSAFSSHGVYIILIVLQQPKLGFSQTRWSCHSRGAVGVNENGIPDESSHACADTSFHRTLVSTCSGT